MTLEFTGIAVSSGIAIGEALTLRRDSIDVTARELDKKGAAAEVRRLKRALKTARVQLLAARDSIPKDAPSDVSSFIETHILMLDDSLFSDRPIEIIKGERINAEAALQRQKVELARAFDAMEDRYLATRIDDVNHVIDTVMRALDVNEDQAGESANSIGGDHWAGRIVVSDDLTPVDTVAMQHHGVAGFVTESGGPLSHTAILARSLGIPAIVGVHSARRYIKAGETLALDGNSGTVLAEVADPLLVELRNEQKRQRQEMRELKKLIDTKSITADGVQLSLMANIDIEEDIKALKRVNAAGVGLYRTEFLYLNRDTIPTEAEHLRAYQRVLRALKGAPLTIRTADLGADKVRPGMNPTSSRSLDRNPALGLRGIRLSLSEPEMFEPQLRAIFRASSKGPVRILLPMLTNVDEVHQCLTLVEQVRSRLREEGVDFDENVPIGGMIEVPAAAIIAEQLAEVLDFLSIGTNDLIQYCLAIDRVDDQVNYLYDPLHPGVLQLIRHIIDAGRKSGKPVSLCGEMAGDTRYVRLLLGLGLTEFSMPPNLLLQVKRALVSSKRSRLRKQALSFLDSTSREERLALLQRINH